MGRSGKGPSLRPYFVGLGLLCAALVLFLWWLRPYLLVSIELKAADAMLSARGERAAPPEVVVVAVDEKSVNELGRWPWSRKRTAALLEALSGARTVAFDITFSEPEDVASDRLLSEAIGRHGNVVLGYFFRDSLAGNEPEAAGLDALAASRVGLVSSTGPLAASLPWPVFPAVETNTEVVGSLAAGFGAFNALAGEDGLYRKSNMVFGFRGELYPALPLEAVRRHIGGGQYMVMLAQYGVDALALDERLIPVDESGALVLNYYGRGGSFRTYSASDVLAGRVGPEEFRGALVFVGVTELALADLKPTPLDPVFPGVEMHATAAANILAGDYITRDGTVVALDIFATVLVAVVLALLLASVRSTVYGLAMAAGLLALLVLAGFHLFSVYDIRTSPVYPALSLLLCYISCEAYRNVLVEKRSRYLKRAFSTYVSSQLLAEILRDPDRLKLGGEKRVVTVLFSDIRGFTSLSEKLSPEKLVDSLNRYLSPMTGIVLEERGLVDKYIGDAIMAVFNAPVEVRDHPDRACRAALRMTEALEGLNAGWKEAGYPPLEVGIGINTGEAVVGNMGAELKLNYTAIGDTVNLASRLEGMNKIYGTSILVSEHTHGAVSGRFSMRELDLVRVKGRDRPITIYELMADSGGQALASEFTDALALYRARGFEKAALAFEAIIERWEDGPSRLYLERCRALASSPPPEDWDGVYTALEK